MKRYIAFDWLRGCAIIGVLCFHIMNVTYDYGSRLADNPPIPYYFLVILLGFIGQFDILFVALSGAVNTISIDKQWQHAMEKDKTPENKQKLASKIMKGQLLRGLVIFGLSYVAETLLNSLLLNTIIQQTDLVGKAMFTVYFTNILQAIALGTMFSALVYVPLLKTDKTPDQRVKILIIVAIILFAATPFMVELSKLFPQFYDSWDKRSLGLNILYVFINPIFRRSTPFFPFATFSIIGTLIGCKISDGKISKSFLDKTFYSALSIFGIGTIIVAIKDFYGLGEMMMVTGGSIFLMMMLLYLVDVEGNGKKVANKTVFFRRFGLVTLTLWSLQWMISIPLLLINAIRNAISGENVPFLQSDIYNQGLTGWEALGCMFVVILMFHLILWGWEKANFKGSFEWLTTKALSGGRSTAGERLDMTQSLYQVESPVEKGERYYGRGTKIGFIVIFLLMSIVYVAFNFLL